jgi:PAS domain S-box-containing protein
MYYKQSRMEEETLHIHFVGDLFKDFGEIPSPNIQIDYFSSSDEFFQAVQSVPWTSSHVVFIAFLSEDSIGTFVMRVKKEYPSLFNSVSLIAYLLGSFTVNQELVKFFDYVLFHPLDQHNLFNIVQYVWMKKQQVIVEKKLSYLNGTIASEITKKDEETEEGIGARAQAGDLLYVVDDRGIIQTIDDHVLHILGFSREEIIGHHFSEIVAQEEFEDVKKAFTERRTGDRMSRGIRVKMKRKDGEYEEFSVDAEGVHIPSVVERPEKDPHRLYVGTLGRVRKKILSGAPFDVFNNSQLPLFIFDPEAKRLIVNSGFERFSGFTAEEVLEREPSDFEMPGHAYFHTCADLIFERQHCTYTTVFKNRSGDERLCEVFLDLVDYGGKACMLGMYTDISVMMTVLDEAEMLIELSWIIGNSDSLEQLLQETVAQGIAILKVPFLLCVVLSESDSSIEHCYYRSGAGSLRSCSQGDEALGVLLPLLDESIRDGKTVYRPTDQVRGLNRMRHLMELDGEGSGTFVTAPLVINQKVIGCLLVFQSRDESFTLHRTRLLEISTNVIAAGIHKLRLERDLRKSLDTLETRVRERTKDLEDFVYTVSHDLKSPLHAARGFAGMIRKQFAQAIRSDEDSFVLRRVEENIELSLQMIDRLLQLSRIGTRELKFERVDLKEIVNDYFLELKALKKEEVHVQLKILDKLPSITADRGRMVQLFTNIFDNSIKYMRGDAVVIEVSAKKRNGGYVITVRDDGIGINGHDLPNVFNIFYRGRVEAESGILEGAGVGLTIVKKIVEQHGGTVQVNSEPGKGTVITIELPKTT